MPQRPSKPLQRRKSSDGTSRLDREERRKSSDGFGLGRRPSENGGSNSKGGSSRSRAAICCALIASLLWGAGLALIFARSVGNNAETQEAQAATAEAQEVPPFYVCGAGLADTNGQYNKKGFSNGSPFFIKYTKHKNDHQ